LQVFRNPSRLSAKGVQRPKPKNRLGSPRRFFCACGKILFVLCYLPVIYRTSKIMLDHKPKRHTAALVHFAISLSLFSLIFLMLINFWYPEPYFASEGGWQGIKIVAGIDVVLGPLLTLIVFNPRKPKRELINDISTIALLQMLAMSYGVYTLYNQRPVAVVFLESSFLTVPAQALNAQNYPLESLSTLSDEKPPLIYAEKPAQLENLKKMMAAITQEHIPPHQQPALYRPLKTHFAAITAQQINIDDVIAKHPDVKNQLQPILQQNKLSGPDARYFILQSKYGNSLLVFSQQGDLLGYVNP
jgi:hypothetical protein